MLFRALEPLVGHRGDGAGSRSRSARAPRSASTHQRPGTPGGSLRHHAHARQRMRSHLAQFWVVDWRRRLSREKYPSHSAHWYQQGSRPSRCGTSLRETGSFPEEKRQPETKVRVRDLTNGCTLSLGSNARKAAPVKAFGRTVGHDSEGSARERPGKSVAPFFRIPQRNESSDSAGARVRWFAPFRASLVASDDSGRDYAGALAGSEWPPRPRRLWLLPTS